MASEIKESKEIPINIKNTYQYLQIFNGITRLTSRELKILSEFVDIQLELRRAGISASNVFSSRNKKKVARKLGFNNYATLNNYVKILSDKRILEKGENGYRVREFLMPWNEKQIVFKLDGGNSGKSSGDKED